MKIFGLLLLSMAAISIWFVVHDLMLTLDYPTYRIPPGDPEILGAAVLAGFVGWYAITAES